MSHWQNIIGMLLQLSSPGIQQSEEAIINTLYKRHYTNEKNDIPLSNIQNTCFKNIL